MNLFLKQILPSLALFQSIHLYVYLGTYLTLFLFVGHANLFTIYLYLYLYLFLTTFNFSTYISFYLPIYLLLASLFLCTSFYVSTINSSASYASFCISLWLPVNLVICSLHSPLFLHLPTYMFLTGPSVHLFDATTQKPSCVRPLCFFVTSKSIHESIIQCYACLSGRVQVLQKPL